MPVTGMEDVSEKEQAAQFEIIKPRLHCNEVYLYSTHRPSLLVLRARRDKGPGNSSRLARETTSLRGTGEEAGSLRGTGEGEADSFNNEALPPNPAKIDVLLFGKPGAGKSSLACHLLSGNSYYAKEYQSEKRLVAEKNSESLVKCASNYVVTVAKPIEPTIKHLFLSNKLSKTGCAIVTFHNELSKVTNETIAGLKKSGLGKVKMMYVLTAVSTSSCNDASADVEENQKLKLILLEQRLLSSHAGSSQQIRILRELIIEFVTTLEGQLQRGLVPHSDAKMVTLLPFRADMRDYLPNMSFFVLQVSFPISLLKKQIALLLLASRVLYTSLEDSLAEVMCEDQALVMQRSSAFLVTENHVIEALIQFSQLQNVFWYIISYNSEKCSMEMMEKVQDTLQQNFRDEFPSREFSIEPLNTCQQQPSNESTEPKEIQQIKTAVEESQSDSGQIYLLVTVKY